MMIVKGCSGSYASCPENSREIYTGYSRVVFRRVLLTDGRVYYVRHVPRVIIVRYSRAGGGAHMPEEEEKKEKIEMAMDMAILMGKQPDVQHAVMSSLFVFKLWDKISLVFGRN